MRLWNYMVGSSDSDVCLLTMSIILSNIFYLYCITIALPLIIFTVHNDVLQVNLSCKVFFLSFVSRFDKTFLQLNLITYCKLSYFNLETLIWLTVKRSHWNSDKILLSFIIRRLNVGSLLSQQLFFPRICPNDICVV